MKIESIRNLNELKSLEGLSIVKCLRKFNTYNVSHIPIGLRNLEQDGITFLVFDNNKIVKFSPNTEVGTINYCFDESIDNNQLTDISNDLFFEKIIGFKIISLSNIFGFIDNSYGIEFTFENGSRMRIVYESESNYEFDALIIR